MPQKMTKTRTIRERHLGKHPGHCFKCSAKKTMRVSVFLKFCPIQKLMTRVSKRQAQNGNDWLYSELYGNSVLTLSLATSILCFSIACWKINHSPLYHPHPSSSLKLFLNESAHSQASWSLIGSTGLQVPKQTAAAAAALHKQAVAERQEGSGGSHRQASSQVWVMASYYIEKKKTWRAHSACGNCEISPNAQSGARLLRLGGWRKFDWRKRHLPTSHLTVNTESPSFTPINCT